jgi:hypothetical protein
MIKDEHFKSLADFEHYGAAIKGKVVRIGQQFNLKRPDHEFTEMFYDIEEYVYASHLQIIKLMAQVESLKNDLASMGTSIEEQFEVHLKEVEPEKVITDEEYGKRKFEGKAPF